MKTVNYQTMHMVLSVQSHFNDVFLCQYCYKSNHLISFILVVGLIKADQEKCISRHFVEGALMCNTSIELI